MTIPAFSQAGTLAHGIGDIVPAWPTHATGHLGILWVETNGQAVATPAGWTLIDKISVGGTVQLTAFYRFATSSGESAPTIVDPGDHASAVITTYTGVHTLYPIHAVGASGQNGSSTAGTLSPVKTSLPDCLIVQGVAWALDSAGPLLTSFTNAALSNLTERFDAGSTDGDGGGIAVADGGLATAGSTGATAIVLGSGSNSVSITLALPPGGQFAVAGTWMINGAAAPNGAVIEVWDKLSRVLAATTVVAGGSGGYTALVPYNDAGRYRVVGDTGGSYGASPLSQAV